MDSSAVSKQLPSLVLYEGGKETKRRPLVDRRAVVTPYTFTEVCNACFEGIFFQCKFLGGKQGVLWVQQQLCTCITLFCTFLYRHYTTTIFNVFFMEDVNKRRQILPLFEFLGIQLPETWPTFDEVSELNNRGEDWKNPNSLLKRRFRRICMQKDFSSQRSRETFLYLTTE